MGMTKREYRYLIKGNKNPFTLPPGVFFVSARKKRRERNKAYKYWT